MKKHFFIIIFALVIITLITGGIFLKNPGTHTAYKGDGYSLEYPKIWKISTENSKLIKLDPREGEEEGTLQDDITIQKIRIDNIDQYLKEPTIVMATEVPSSVNGTQGYAYIDTKITEGFVYLFPMKEHYHYLKIQTNKSSKELSELVEMLKIE